VEAVEGDEPADSGEIGRLGAVREVPESHALRTSSIGFLGFDGLVGFGYNARNDTG
jgi:hypothetical protein